MKEKNYSKRLKEESPDIKKYYWDIAFGLQDVDGLKPSKYMTKLSRQHINGKTNFIQICEKITSYYEKEQSTYDISDQKEADFVSIAIYEILSDETFKFDYLSFKDYHQKLFCKLDKNIYGAGKFRKYNVTKNEPILENDTVIYQSNELIEESLKYDFTEEKNQDYSKFTKDQLLDRICEFTARIWQVHPFQEGNTRTTAVFIQKYLISMNLNINNEIFKNNALYFRNALVRANYVNYNKRVNFENKYLKMFFENLLFNKGNKLDNKELFINK